MTSALRQSLRRCTALLGGSGRLSARRPGQPCRAAGVRPGPSRGRPAPGGVWRPAPGGVMCARVRARHPSEPETWGCLRQVAAPLIRGDGNWGARMGRVRSRRRRLGLEAAKPTACVYGRGSAVPPPPPHLALCLAVSFSPLSRSLALPSLPLLPPSPASLYGLNSCSSLRSLRSGAAASGAGVDLPW